MLAKEKPTSFNSNTDKICLSPSPQLLQQSVELFINLREVPGPLQEWQDPRKRQEMSWSEADEDLDLHSRKDVYKGHAAPQGVTRSRWHQCLLTLMVFSLYQSAKWHGLYHFLNTQLSFVWKYCPSVSVPASACGGYSLSRRLQPTDYPRSGTAGVQSQHTTLDSHAFSLSPVVLCSN